MSRPFVSAPRKNSPFHVGPIGMPSSDTTFVSFPSITIVSVRWFLYGVGVGDVVRPQRRRDGRSTTSTMKRTPKASASCCA